ncbi:hypothetical cytosolic protein [Syntrophus aciditrophicus SB]|uniref:Hypothetical cytosolic protein n=1 Tax=Syntrophus aciditrophicus (strain SB) TaxID=56780 RepID=Q2LW09_SYNAS|nr:hypothetical cytosolic protein [Syntrophus aciditrophicus SB]
MINKFPWTTKNKTKAQLIKELEEARKAQDRAEENENILNAIMKNIPAGITIATIRILISGWSVRNSWRND